MVNLVIAFNYICFSTVMATSVENNPEIFEDINDKVVSTSSTHQDSVQESQVGEHFENETPKEHDIIKQFSDVKFEVEDEIIHANRGCLAFHSPVLHAMFTADFKEKTSEVIPLPGKSVLGMQKFVEVTHLAAPVTTANIYDLMPIAAEYQCERLLQQCDDLLETQEFSVLNLAVSGQYALKKSLKKFIQMGAQKSIQELKADEYYGKVPERVIVDIYEESLQCLSSENKKNKTNLEELTKQCQDLRWYKMKLEEIVTGLKTNVWNHSAFCVSRFGFNGKCLCRQKKCDHKAKNMAVSCYSKDAYQPQLRQDRYFSVSYVTCGDCIQQTLWHVLECLNNKP